MTSDTSPILVWPENGPVLIQDSAKDITPELRASLRDHGTVLVGRAAINRFISEREYFLEEPSSEDSPQLWKKHLRGLERLVSDCAEYGRTGFDLKSAGVDATEIQNLFSVLADTFLELSDRDCRNYGVSFDGVPRALSGMADEKQVGRWYSELSGRLLEQAFATSDQGEIFGPILRRYILVFQEKPQLAALSPLERENMARIEFSSFLSGRFGKVPRSAAV